MSEPTQAEQIIDAWPGKTRFERRRALATALGHPNDEKVRYWEKSGQVPQRDHQDILDAAGCAKPRVRLKKLDFVRHLKDPAEAAATAAQPQQ